MRARSGGSGERGMSAREKLAQFERQDRGRQRLTRRIVVVLGLVVLLLVGRAVLLEFAADDNAWFDHPKDGAWMVREGRWDDFAELLSGDLEIHGVAGLKSRSDLLSFLRSRGEQGLPCFATHPHAFGESGEERWLSFFAVWARGELSRPDAVPIVRVWLVHAIMRREEGVWRARRLDVRPGLPDEGGGEGALRRLLEEGEGR